jgi:hypothetical protein
VRGRKKKKYVCTENQNLNLNKTLLVFMPYWIFHFFSITFRFGKISFRFVSFDFVSFRFVSFRFIWFRFVSFRSVSFCFVWFRFVSFGFVPFRFVSISFRALQVPYASMSWQYSKCISQSNTMHIINIWYICYYNSDKYM